MVLAGVQKRLEMKNRRRVDFGVGGVAATCGRCGGVYRASAEDGVRHCTACRAEPAAVADA